MEKTVLDSTTIYEKYPAEKDLCDYLTGKRNCTDLVKLEKFFNKLREDNVILDITCMDVKPGKGRDPFYCGGLHGIYEEK